MLEEKIHIPKKILFCGFDSPLQTKSLTSVLEAQSFDLVGLFSCANHFGDTAQIFLSQKEALSMTDYEKHRTKDMPGRHLIEALQSDANVVMKMMEQISSNSRQAQEHEYRKHCYYALLSFFFGFLKKHQFEQLIFSRFPSDPCSLILFSLSKQLGLTNHFIYALPAHHTFLAGSTLSGIFAQCALPGIAPEGKELPPHLSEERARRKAGEIHKSPPVETTSSMLESLVYKFPSWLAHTRLKKVKTTDSFQFVYFPLEDEANSPITPASGVFIDTYYAVIMAARALPEGVTLLVQESNQPHYLHRTPGFYKLLEDEPNISFVHPRLDRIQLIKDSLAVATIAGDLGWTALFHHKRVFVFGQAFYQNLPGVHRIRSIADIESALKNNKQICTEEDLTQFLHHLDHISHHDSAGIVQALENFTLSVRPCS